METFAPSRPWADHPGFGRERREVLGRLRIEQVDAPLRPAVEALAGRGHCFPLQCCFGHFVHAGRTDPGNLESLPAEDPGPVTYRIAYLALCLAHSREGRALRRDLERLAAADPGLVQFGSPRWFWDRHPNAFALQVEPARHAFADTAVLGHAEALRVQRARDRFVEGLGRVLRTAAAHRGARDKRRSADSYGRICETEASG